LSPLRIHYFRTSRVRRHSVGNETVVWSDFTAGTPPDSAFNVPGEQYCQIGDDDKCSQDDTTRSYMARFGYRMAAMKRE
jgi:hypothetical protein